MKSLRLIGALIIVAFTGFGCALTESANNSSMTHRQVFEQELPPPKDTDATQGNYLGWDVFYTALELGGTLLSGK